MASRRSVQGAVLSPTDAAHISSGGGTAARCLPTATPSAAINIPGFPEGGLPLVSPRLARAPCHRCSEPSHASPHLGCGCRAWTSPANLVGGDWATAKPLPVWRNGASVTKRKGDRHIALSLSACFRSHEAVESPHDQHRSRLSDSPRCYLDDLDPRRFISSPPGSNSRQG